jgi:DHA2 family lincomycin resistance protein-like MFS transporter
VQFSFLVAGAFATTILLPLLLQQSLGLGVFETGLFMVPGGLTIAIGSIIAGKLYPRLGARALMISGAVIIAAGWWILSTIDQTTPVLVVLATYIFICAGQAIAWTPIYTLSLGSLPDELHAHGSAALNTIQQLIGAAGLAILVGILTANTISTDPAAIALGAQAAFTAGGVIALAGLAASLFTPSRSRQMTQHNAAQLVETRHN